MISLKTLQHTLASTRRVAASSPWAIRVLARPTASSRFLSTISASHFKESEDQDQDEEGDVSHAQHYAHSTAAASQDPTPHSPSFSSAADTQQTHFDLQRVKLAASRAQTPLSIAQCLRLGDSLGTKSLLKNISFLNRELPVRFSKRIVELGNLPTELRKTEPFMSLVQNYSASFHELQSYSDNSRLWFLSPSIHHTEGIDLDDNETMQRTIQREYADLLQRVTNRHKQDVVYMAHGISLFKRYQLNRNRPSEEIRHFLNSFNRGRLGIRIMIGHHLALQRQLLFPDAPPASTTNSKRVGIIEPQCDIEALIMNATQSAQFVFFQHYNTVFPPHVHLEHSKELGGKMVRFPVVPALLHHILFELLKNSMRATAEFHGLDKPSYPDILVKLSTTPEGNLSIVIKDHGGGLPQRQITKPFDYMFTTASNTVCLDFPSIISAIESKPQTSATGENLPLCGFGFGLATSKLYAQLFGGDLELQSTPGYGTEAHIQMRRLEDQIEQFTDH